MGFIFSNHALNCAALGWFLAQFFKGVFDSVKSKKIRIDRFFGAGGMPSSHSAMVSALLTMIFFIDGFASTTFAVAAVFAFITVYDAAGVRYAVGEQAKIINKIIITDNDITRDELFKELMGHTKPEVMAGCILGILISCGYWLLFLK